MLYDLAWCVLATFSPKSKIHKDVKHQMSPMHVTTAMAVLLAAVCGVVAEISYLTSAYNAIYRSGRVRYTERALDLENYGCKEGSYTRGNFIMYIQRIHMIDCRRRTSEYQMLTDKTKSIEQEGKEGNEVGSR